MVMSSPINAAFPCRPGNGLTRSWARPRAMSPGKLGGHVGDGTGRARCHLGQPRRNTKQVLDAMAHLASEKLTPLFACLRLITSRKIPVIWRATMSSSLPWPRPDIHLTSRPLNIRKSIS